MPTEDRMLNQHQNGLIPLSLISSVIVLYLSVSDDSQSCSRCVTNDNRDSMHHWKGVKRKLYAIDSVVTRLPTKRRSPNRRREEDNCQNFNYKLKQIEDAEVFLSRSVLINSTMKRMYSELYTGKAERRLLSNKCSRMWRQHLEYRWSYTRGHFIWNLWNEPLASFINFIWNDHSCKILFIIWPFKLDFIVFKVDIISIENATLSRTSLWRYMYAPKCYVTCDHNIFMTWRYPLNNSDVIW